MINLLEDIDQPQVDYLYHGTSEYAETIRKKGLIAGRHGSVFLTDNPELAVEYAVSDQDRTGLDNVTLCKVAVSDLDAEKLHPDIDHTNVETWQESLSDCDQCMYQGDIGPWDIDVEEL